MIFDPEILVWLYLSKFLFHIDGEDESKFTANAIKKKKHLLTGCSIFKKDFNVTFFFTYCYHILSVNVSNDIYIILKWEALVFHGKGSEI